MKWYKISQHEYMDEQQEIKYRLDTAQNVIEYVTKMNALYSGGTTQLLGSATKAEILEYVIANDLELTPELKANILNDNYYA